MLVRTCRRITLFFWSSIGFLYSHKKHKHNGKDDIFEQSKMTNLCTIKNSLSGIKRQTTNNKEIFALPRISIQNVYIKHILKNYK